MNKKVKFSYIVLSIGVGLMAMMIPIHAMDKIKKGQSSGAVVYSGTGTLRLRKVDGHAKSIAGYDGVEFSNCTLTIEDPLPANMHVKCTMSDVTAGGKKVC